MPHLTFITVGQNDNKEVYDTAQAEFEKRKENKNYKTTATCFSGIVFCSECGSIYGSKVWHSTGNSLYNRADLKSTVLKNYHSITES